MDDEHKVKPRLILTFRVPTSPGTFPGTGTLTRVSPEPTAYPFQNEDKLVSS